MDNDKERQSVDGKQSETLIGIRTTAENVVDGGRQSQRRRATRTKIQTVTSCVALFVTLCLLVGTLLGFTDTDTLETFRPLLYSLAARNGTAVCP